MGESPSSILSRAADLIRDAAAKTDTSAPWEVRGLHRMAKGCRCGSCNEDAPWAFEVWPLEGPEGDDRCIYATHLNEPDARWIALLNPAVAPALEALLRGFVPMALQVEAHGSFPGDSQSFARYHAALEFARVILGEEQP